MYARVVHGGEEAFDAMVYGQPSAKLREYLNNTIEVAAAKLNGVGSYFMDTVRDVYEQYNGNMAMSRARALVSTLDNHINPDVFISYDVNNIMHASPRMQEYIMVQPELFELNQQQACSAYDGTAYDAYPDVDKVEEHVRYQEVMDGIMQYDDDGEGYIISYTNTSDEELHIHDQFTVLDNWHSVCSLLADGIDPTSPDGDEL